MCRIGNEDDKMITIIPLFWITLRNLSDALSIAMSVSFNIAYDFAENL
jgi:hypothetical protein